MKSNSLTGRPGETWAQRKEEVGTARSRGREGPAGGERPSGPRWPWAVSSGPFEACETICLLNSIYSNNETSVGISQSRGAVW